MEKTAEVSHKGPHAGMLATVFALLFNTGLYFVISLTGNTHFPGPWESQERITTYFMNHAHDAMLCALFQFGSAMPLVIFTATMVSRLRFLKITAAGPNIALVGGILAAINLAASALILWVMTVPAVSQNMQIIPGLYYLVFAIGGVGYSVPIGLLIAGIAISAGIPKLIPGWLMWSGILLGICGEASWLSMAFPQLLLLIPLTRFPGFIWLALAGFMLPRKTVRNVRNTL